MLRITILFPPGTGAYEAFLAPVIVNKRKLRKKGIEVSIAHPHLYDRIKADIVVVSSLVARHFQAEVNVPSDEVATSRIFSLLELLKKRAEKVYWFDMSDSSGSNQFRYLPFVDRFLKAYVLKDVTVYRKAFYRDRPYTDYYHEKFGISDRKPPPQRELPRTEELSKIKVGWSSALGDYGLMAPYLRKLRQYLPMPHVFKSRMCEPKQDRRIDINARFGTGYNRATVAYQREKLMDLVDKLGAVSARFPRNKYFRELSQCKIIVSPFGWGEVCFRDYEAFLSGALLVKPDMSHMVTWPDLYQKSVTYAAFRWDLSNVEEVIAENLNRNRWLDIASEGQKKYRYCFSEEGNEEFCGKFMALIDMP